MTSCREESSHAKPPSRKGRCLGEAHQAWRLGVRNWLWRCRDGRTLAPRYGNGKHLAWLCARHEVTKDPKHAEQARAVFRGAATCGLIRPLDQSGFAEIVRGVLPDGETYYVGKHRGSGGDNFNGYSFGLWTYYRSGLATAADKQTIRKIVQRSWYRGGRPAFMGMARDMVSKGRWHQWYAQRRRQAIREAAAVTSTLEQSSGTAPPRLLHWRALLDLERDATAKKAFRHAMRVNAWGRVNDLLKGLEFDESNNDYWHRVNCVRNPMDAMLTVMLSGDDDAITALLPLWKQVVGRIDPTGLWDQRQLTPLLGAYWLGVRGGHIAAESWPGDIDPTQVERKTIDPSRNPIVTYFAEANPRAPSPDGTPFRFPRADD